MPTLTKTIIEAAIGGFEAQKRQLDSQIAELRAILDGGMRVPVSATPKKHRRKKMSAAAIERIREGQKRRWAAARGETVAAPAMTEAKPKRRLSAAGRKNIVAALKKRWAAKKAAAKA
jgi:hypothetical protein